MGRVKVMPHSLSQFNQLTANKISICGWAAKCVNLMALFALTLPKLHLLPGNEMSICGRAAKMYAAERKVPSFAEVHIPATDGSTFLQLKMAGAGIPGAKCKI